MPRTQKIWLIDRPAYDDMRRRCREGELLAQPCVVRLRSCAERICRIPAPAVTDKQFTRHSPSRDPHDYVSIATYWWPSPKTLDGLPYESRDGQLSPDIEFYDRPRWEQAANGIVTLIRAAWFLDEPRFARTAISWLRRWFVDSHTRMNPHLAFAQFIPGICSGRQYGIIDFALYLPHVLEHVRLLAEIDDSLWTADDQRALAAWCESLLSWFESHAFGKQEEATANNHGVHYDRLVVGLALYLNRWERATAQMTRSRERIAQQIEPDGTMPRELKRTCSFSYTLMNTRCFVDLAWVGSRLDMDLWSLTGPDGQSIHKAVNFLYDFACSDRDWPGEQIEPVDWRMICPILDRASILSNCRYELAAVAHRMPANFVPGLFPMVEPIHPFGRPRSTEESHAI